MNYTGGRIQFIFKEWSKLTTDSVILNMVQGYKIDLATKPYQSFAPCEPVFSATENEHIRIELAK